jgi:hypothetical protein
MYFIKDNIQTAKKDENLLNFIIEIKNRATTKHSPAEMKKTDKDKYLNIQNSTIHSLSNNSKVIRTRMVK